MNSVKTRKLPRLAKILDKYLPLIEGKCAAELSFDERIRLKGQYVRQLRAELAQMKARRAGFTLVEMLVAVALVLLMMTLFATIFQMATSAMSQQKGMAENDQRVRLVLTRMRNDLNGRKQGQDANDPNRPYRTFRNIVAYGPDETPLITTDRSGYFYISENDPNDDTDDVIALTVQFPPGSPDLYMGRAAVVFSDGGGSYGPGNPTPGAAPYPPAAPATVNFANTPTAGTSYWPNQPEFDDIQGTPNGVGDSQFAEVCYFLRRGTLYRRVLLIRQPNVLAMPDGTPTDNQPTSLNMNAVYGQGAANLRNFWTDFDYSAFFDLRGGNGLRFHGSGSGIGIDSLAAGGGVTNPFTLGNPAFRFGFDSTTQVVGGARVPDITYGLPREFVTTPNGATPANTTFFIGRFTQSETSDTAFGYPGNLNTDPMNNTSRLNFNVATGAAGNFAGPRGGEDVLMTNVLKFDIKVFDPAASVGPDGAPGIAGVDDDGINGPDDIGELGWPGSDDGDFRDIGHSGVTGLYNQNPQNVPVTMKYRGIPSAPTNLSTYTNYYPNLRYKDPSNNVNRFDTWNPALDHNNDGISDSPPFRPFSFGADGKPGVPFVDDDMDGIVDNASELGWPNPGSDDQPIPLTAIQIKITFYDKTSKQVKESTMVQSLRYTP